MDKKWNSVYEVHNHAKTAIGKPIKELVKKETIDNYKKSPKNKGWIGNSVEADWFGIKNNNRDEADIPNLNLDIKVTPIVKTRNGWSAKERLTLNIFNFNEEYKKTFETASFFEQFTYIELIYYEYVETIISPDLLIKNAILLDLSTLPEEDLLIMKNDWQIIVDKINEGKAEELSDSLTQYLAATTKGSKTEKNMTTQPFSDVQAHRRAFTFKTSYMTYLARKFMDNSYTSPEKIVKEPHMLKTMSFEEIIIEKFKPYYGMTKKDLAEKFDVKIKSENDKASSRVIMNKILNLENDIEKTDEFIKSNIALKIVTIQVGSKARNGKPKTTEGFKLQNWSKEFTDINETFKQSNLFKYLTETRFLLAVYKRVNGVDVFLGVKFWNVPISDIYGDIQHVFNDTKNKLKTGVSLDYKSTETGYRIKNNFIKMSDDLILHVRPDTDERDYSGTKNYCMKLPVKSIWSNRPIGMEAILSDYFMTKQAYWFNPTYMYNVVCDLL